MQQPRQGDAAEAGGRVAEEVAASSESMNHK
jgi:hypothetical protein